MKILYILDYFYPHVGGVPTLFMNLAKQMIKLGHEVHIITSRIPGTKREENWKGMKITRLGENREGFMYDSTLQMMSTKEKFDVIHTSTYSAMIPAFVFSFFKRTPCVLSVHEIWGLKEWIEFTKWKGPFYFIEERLLFTIPFDCYISPSNHTKRDLIEIGVKSSEIETIPHGINHSVFNPTAKKYRNHVRNKIGIKKDEVLCCFIGKPTEFKGIRYLLDAVEKSLDRTNLKFVFVFARGYQTEYQSLVGRIESSEILKGNVKILHPKPEEDFTSKLIGASDFVVMPSLSEGFGFVAAESASVGIPVIVTKDTSLEEVVSDGKNGIFVKPRDSENLAEEIVRLATRSDLRKKLSKPKKFDDWEKVALKYEKIYKDLLKNY